MIFYWLRKFYNYYFSADRALTRKLSSILGFVPSRIYLYKLAFYHKSMNDEMTNKSHNNERLEFLGDAILSTIVAEYLFKKYPGKNEGFLTKMRSKIVKRQTLNSVADNMGLDVILNEYSQGKMSKAMMGNALEALVGAIYLENGFFKTKEYVISKILMKYLDIHSLEKYDDNYKSQLLEWCQKNGKEVDYRLLQKFKYDKRDRFKVAVTVDGKEIAIAEDFNKKSAEQNASSIALKRLDIQKVQ